MAEPQLVDYIKKARASGQSDDQTKSLLLKNGWTETEVSEAFAAEQPSQPQPQVQTTTVQPAAQPQTVSQPKIEAQPKATYQPQPVQTQQQPKYQPQQPIGQKPVSYKKPASHLIAKIFISLTILIILCGGAYIAAGQYFDFSWSLKNLLRPNPETVINKMITNMSSVTSSQLVTRGNIIVKDSDKNLIGTISFNTDVKGSIKDAKNPQFDAVLSFGLSAENYGITSSSVNLKAKFVDGITYVSLSDIKLPNGNLSNDVKFAIEVIKGKWFKIDGDSVTALSALQPEQASVPNITEVNNAELTKKVTNLFSSKDILVFNKELDDETISEQDSYHYLMLVDREKVKSLLGQIASLAIQESAKAQPEGSMTEETITAAKNLAQSYINKNIDAVGDIYVEVWIGKKDFMLYGVKMDKVIDLSKTYEGIPSVEIKFDTTSSRFNEDITVQAPEDAQKIEDFILPLVKPQVVQSDLESIYDIATVLYAEDENISPLCYKGLLNGYLDVYGEDLVALHTDIVTHGASKPTCYANKTGFCVSTQLEDKSYLCIDVLGMVGTTKCVSATTACK